MSKKDLERFIQKVKQLNSLVDSLEVIQGRKELLTNCTHHNQVVDLANSWGYQIGQRWGELDLNSDVKTTGNLLSCSLPEKGEESKELLHEGNDWLLELMLFNGARTKDDIWIEEEERKWILVLRGSATLWLKDPDQFIDLSVGDHLMIETYRSHRFERTDHEQGTIFLSFSWSSP